MSNRYVHVRPSEPVARLNHHDPASPFAVVDLNGDCYLTSEDPAWCRRVAAAWTHAAELLESAQRDRQPASANGQRPARPELSGMRSP